MGKRLAVIGTIIVAAALLGGAGITVQSQADVTCAELKTWIDKARASYRRRDFHRPVAWGPAAENHAFVHYRRASELAPSADDVLHRYWWQVALRRLPENTPELTAEEQAAVRAAWAPALAELRQGAHCVDARPWLDLDRPSLACNLLAARWLTNLSVIDSIEATAKGEPQRGIESQLDALAFAFDLMRSCQTDRLIGTAIANIILMQGLDEDRVRQLDRSALDLLATGLARLDSDAQAVEEPADEALWTTLWLQQGPDHQVHGPSWRFGFSSRWQTADALLSMCRDTERPTGATASWPAREPMLRQAEQDAETRGGPAQGNCWFGVTATEFNVRTAIARLRCLRLSIDHRRCAALPQLADPLGNGPIAVERREDGLRIASVGRVAGQWIERIAVR